MVIPAAIGKFLMLRKYPATLYFCRFEPRNYSSPTRPRVAMLLRLSSGGIARNPAQICLPVAGPRRAIFRGMKHYLVLALALLASPLVSAADAPSPANSLTAIKAGHLLDVASGQFLQRQVIVISGETIHSVGPAADIAVPANARLIDLTDSWVLPGLIDCHVHLTSD